MSLQTRMPNRRTFLERSVLGAGSVLFLPGLLASCADHIVPSPITGPPPLGGFKIDFNDTAKTIVVKGLGLIPEVGELLGGLLANFWPSTREDIWGEIRAQVEALINQKISDLVYRQVSDDLAGLHNSLTLYLTEVKNGTPGEKLTQWIVTRNLFVNALPHFQSKSYEVLLLPLFAQFANMYLSILRDGVISGKTWGRNDADQKQDVTDLKNAISDFTAYVTTTYNNGRAYVLSATPTDLFWLQPFTAVNKYDRQMTLTVLDFSVTWPYFDVTLYPTGTKVVLTREIYHDPYGNVDDPYHNQSGPIVITTSVPTQPPTQVVVWGGDVIDAVQLTYPANSGPGGVTQTPRMGDQPGVYGPGGSNQPPHGGIFNLSPNNPIVAVGTLYRQHTIIAMKFKFYDGTETYLLSGARWGGVNQQDSGLISYTHEYMSSIHINGTSRATGTADVIVYGFQYWNEEPTATLSAIQVLYVRSPKERSAADFIQAFPTLGISAALITDELKAARQAYWADVEARAKALK